MIPAISWCPGCHKDITPLEHADDVNKGKVRSLLSHYQFAHCGNVWTARQDHTQEQYAWKLRVGLLGPLPLESSNGPAIPAARPGRRTPMQVRSTARTR